MIVSSITTDLDLGYPRDFDVSTAGTWVGLFERSGIGYQVHHSANLTFRLNVALGFPRVRLLGTDYILIVDGSTRQTPAGAHIFRTTGQYISSFDAGVAMQDIVILDDIIAITYFDEGRFSGVFPSNEGIAFFDHSGQYLWGYLTMLGDDAVDISDCYCACRIDGDSMAFSPYQGFPLVRISPRTRLQTVTALPSELMGASAISMHGEAMFIYDPYDARGTMFRWLPGNPPEEIGPVDGPLRGLEMGQFLQLAGRGFNVIDPSAA